MVEESWDVCNPKQEKIQRTSLTIWEWEISVWRHSSAIFFLSFTHVFRLEVITALCPWQLQGNTGTVCLFWFPVVAWMQWVLHPFLCLLSIEWFACVPHITTVVKGTCGNSTFWRKNPSTVWMSKYYGQPGLPDHFLYNFCCIFVVLSGTHCNALHLVRCWSFWKRCGGVGSASKLSRSLPGRKIGWINGWKMWSCCFGMFWKMMHCNSWHIISYLHILISSYLHINTTTFLVCSFSLKFALVKAFLKEAQRSMWVAETNNSVEWLGAIV